MTNRTEKIHCCKTFQESVDTKKIIRAEDPDETEWYFPKGFHLYFCPFCGTNVQGRGFAKYRVAGTPLKRERIRESGRVHG
jgi:hypothetical protein